MNRAEEMLERIAVGIEKLGEEPSFEIPTSPPVCPTCGMIDPVIGIQKDVNGAGKLSDFFMSVSCTNCNSHFFAIPQGWVNAQSTSELHEIMGKGGNGNSRNSN